MRRRLGLLALLFARIGCHDPDPTASPTSSPPPTASVPTSSEARNPPAVQIDELPISGDLPAYVLRGARAHDQRVLFVPGMCSHPLGYVQAFQWAAAERGDLVTLQGDVPCGGAYRKWSGDLDAMKRRIDGVFAAAGVDETDVTVVGYSQGAERAERLAERWPETFTRVVLIASPVVPSPARLRHVHAAVLMAGTRDAQTNMRSGLALLRAADIPTTFIALPNARHGELGDDPEATFREVFAWLRGPESRP